MRVLLVVHGFPPRAGRGTEIYVRDLARALHEGFADDVLVLAREEDPHRRELAVRRERRDGITVAFVNNTFRDCRSFEESYRHPALRRVAAEIVDDFDPEVAHVHHLTCLSTEIVTDLAERGVPVVLTLNDYWLMCHRGQLLDRDYRQCAGPAATGCGRCVDVAGGAAGLAYRAAALARGVSARVPASVSRVLDTVGRAALTGTVPQAAVAEATRRRAAHMRSLLPLVTRVLAPSQTIADRFTAFGVAPEQMVRQEQGIDIRPFRTHPRVAGDRLRLGFVGSLLISKGPHVALEAFAGLPAAAASLTVLGAHADYHGDAHYRARLAPLLVQPGVVHAGAVARAEVARALSAMDALIVPSVWIENAPFVIREAFAAGVPVIASRLGGMAEMVRDGVDGLLFSAGDVGDLRRTLHRLLEEPGLLDTLRAGIRRVRTIEEDAAWTREIYGGLRASSPPRVTGRARVAAVVLNYRTPDDTALAVRSLLASRRAPDDVIVVDNGSGDGSVASLRALPPAVTVMETASNLGYSAGCNVGIREALARKADLVWLVNSDVVAPPDALERLEDALAFEPRAGIAGPVVLSRAHPETVASLGVTFSSVTGRMRSLGFGARYGTVAPPACGVIDAVNGCAMLVRREVFERVGLLTEDYFFSFEDLDFCLRARAAGFLTILAGSAVVYHEGARSIGARSARRVYYATRNHLLLARRAAPAPGPARGLLRAGVIVGLNLAHALLTAGVPRAAGVAAVARGAWDHARGRYGAGPGPAALS